MSIELIILQMLYIKQIVKILLSGFCAIVILSVLLVFYNFTPVHIDNPRGNTDYIWPANSVWIKMTEGISCGKFDSNGYNNLKVIDKPDIIILGSSHMEATNIKQNETIATLLNKRFKGKHLVYNLGISGHDFYKTCQYLRENIRLYKANGMKTIIIETSKATVTERNVEDIVNHAIKKTPSYSSGILYFMQRIPFLRVLNFQIESGLLKLLSPPQKTNKKKDERKISEENTTIDVQAYSRLFKYLATLQKENDVQIVVFYHPTGIFEKNGSLAFPHQETSGVFAKSAMENGIVFIDMTEPFKRMYNEEHHVPHGFATGRLCTGHLNAYGHKSVAEELAPMLEKMLKDCKP